MKKGIKAQVVTSKMDEQTEGDSNMNRILDREELLLGMSDRTLMFLGDSDISKIAEQTIALAGLGGVGAIVLELLVRMGVSKFRLLDMDKYELSNMNRQIFATSNTLGCWKVDVGVARIKEINPYAEVEMAFREKANRDNVDRFIEGADILIVETDTPSSKSLFYESARKHRVPLINGFCRLINDNCRSIVGGAVQIFDYRDPRQVDAQRLFRLPVLNNIAHKLVGPKEKASEMTDEELEQLDSGKVPTASLNFVTNLIGCLVVSETVKLITGMGESCRYPKEISINLSDLEMKVRSVRSLGNAVRRIKQC